MGDMVVARNRPSERGALVKLSVKLNQALASLALPLENSWRLLYGLCCPVSSRANQILSLTRDIASAMQLRLSFHRALSDLSTRTRLSHKFKIRSCHEAPRMGHNSPAPWIFSSILQPFKFMSQSQSMEEGGARSRVKKRGVLSLLAAPV
ncbi:hypothetical protein BC826DRAFT_414752 [Russula brevipes]|nr:hypothetical protein BC826DRAFT_414752 [Russula brevipes]